jgi:hypothetical protein
VNDRARFPRFLSRNTAVPARGRRGETAHARSVIVTFTETGFAAPDASAIGGDESAQSAPTATRAVGSRSFTFLLIGG